MKKPSERSGVEFGKAEDGKITAEEADEIFEKWKSMSETAEKYVAEHNMTMEKFVDIVFFDVSLLPN